jgi:hypothetical protein
MRLEWTKLSKGHYTAESNGHVTNLDVYEPDKARYVWLVSLDDVPMAARDHIPAAKTAAATLLRGKPAKPGRMPAPDARPVILRCALTRTRGTIRPPKPGKVTAAKTAAKTAAPAAAKTAAKTAAPAAAKTAAVETAA